jgi:hypothetical protein
MQSWRVSCPNDRSSVARLGRIVPVQDKRYAMIRSNFTLSPAFVARNAALAGGAADVRNDVGLAPFPAMIFGSAVMLATMISALVWFG